MAPSNAREGVDVAGNDDTASLRYPGGGLDLEIVHATEGSDGIALGSRCWPRPKTPTFDQGLSTPRRPRAPSPHRRRRGDSALPGLPIDQLAEKSTFIEVSYLLIYGELPTAEQLAAFTTQIQRHTTAA